MNTFARLAVSLLIAGGLGLDDPPKRQHPWSTRIEKPNPGDSMHWPNASWFRAEARRRYGSHVRIADDAAVDTAVITRAGAFVDGKLFVPLPRDKVHMESSPE